MGQIWPKSSKHKSITICQWLCFCTVLGLASICWVQLWTNFIQTWHRSRKHNFVCGRGHGPAPSAWGWRVDPVGPRHPHLEVGPRTTPFGVGPHPHTTWCWPATPPCGAGPYTPPHAPAFHRLAHTLVGPPTLGGMGDPCRGGGRPHCRHGAIHWCGMGPPERAGPQKWTWASPTVGRGGVGGMGQPHWGKVAWANEIWLAERKWNGRTTRRRPLLKSVLTHAPSEDV